METEQQFLFKKWHNISLVGYLMTFITTVEETISITNARMEAIINDSVESAKAVKLQYVSDQQLGITRVRKGKKNFEYYFNGKKVTDIDTLNRIKRLVLPPAWEGVWICSKENGHLQATGYDVMGRKQYKYHALWSAVRNETKFYKMLEFGRALPAIREQVEKDIALPGLQKRKVLAAIVSITDKTGIRIGSSFYEKLYGSFGLSTLQNKHVQINGSSVRFMFKGKKGVYHDVSLKSRKLAKIIQQCRDIPGKELFQYYSDDGTRQSIDSGEVNEYIKELAQAEFTSKDFRTWAGTVQCLLAFHEIGEGENKTQMKKNVVAALDKVAASLGNTRSICKKHYVHPLIITCYESEKLSEHLKKLRKTNGHENELMQNCEQILMKMLDKETR